MINKGLYQAPRGIEEEVDSMEPDIQVEIENPDSVTISADGLEITMVPDETQGEDFAANLAELLDDDVLGMVSTELLDLYSSDFNSRSDWEKTYKEGLDVLGLKIEERSEPWDGACGVTHPLLAEAVVRFQSETIMETFPASGPVKTKIIGKVNKQTEEVAGRVKDDMNHWTTDKMPDYRSEHERLLWSLPIAGCAFKKVYFDPTNDRPVASFVPAEDFIISYGATDLESAARYAHRMKKTKNEIRKLQVSGFYRDVELGDPIADIDDIQKAKDDTTGISSGSDDRYTILEYHVDLDLPGYEDTDDEGNETGIELPYVVHIEKGTGIILAIYRNWREDDTSKRKRVHFTKYSYVPGFGFYDFGLIHLVGGFAKGATSLLRQLVDAGTLSNLPGGLKARGLRIKGDDTPIAPGEFRDVDVPSGSIRDNIMPLPYNEPSMVLHRLLEQIVAEGRRFAAVADVNVADMQPNAPVGSTLAILERTLKTMSAIQARVHAAMKCEFRILKEIIRDHTPATYSYDVDADFGSMVKQADYDLVEVIPVSDPNATTLSQRIAQYQAALQLAQTAPEMYDMPALHRQMLEVLGIRNADKILPDPDNVAPMDPVSENMAIVTGKPVKAFIYQDHEAHIATHMAFAQDPKVQQMLQQLPNAQAITAAGAAHLSEHLAFAYRRQLEEQLGVPLPSPEERLPEDVEVDISRLVAEAADKLLRKNTAEAEQERIEQQQQDPVLQLQIKDVEIKQAEVQRKAQKDQLDHQLEVARLQLEREKLASNEKVEGTKIGAKLATENLRTETQQKVEGFKKGADIAKQQIERGAQ